MNRCRITHHGHRRGAAAVELALVMPVVITIVFGCIDFGRFAHSYIAVTNAARAGAGFASTNPFTSTTKPVWDSKLQQVIADEMNAINGFDPALAQFVSSRTFDTNGLARVKVEVTYPFATVVPWSGFPNQMSVWRAVEVRVIR